MNERFETFTVLINRLSRNARKIKNQAFAEYNLKSPHVSCLYYLYLSQELTASELCEKCEEDKATISRALDHLEQNGYLSQRSNDGKRYKYPLILTEQGMELGRKIANTIDQVLQETSIGLSDSERQEFYRCLAIISKNLDTAANDFHI